MSLIKDIPLASIVLDQAYQPRYEGGNDDGLWPEHLDRLVNSNPMEWPPVLVKPQGNETYLMIDGFHRYKAAELQGELTIKAEIDELADLLAAYERNLKHGMPLTKDERKRYAYLLHQQHPQLSYREIGRRAGLDDHTVKAAIEPQPADTPQQSNRQAYEPSGHTPDMLDTLLRLVKRAATDQAGVSKLAQFFSGKSDAQQRAEAIKTRLEGFEDTEQQTMVAAAQTIGQALVDGAKLLKDGK